MRTISDIVYACLIVAYPAWAASQDTEESSSVSLEESAESSTDDPTLTESSTDEAPDVDTEERTSEADTEGDETPATDESEPAEVETQSSPDDSNDDTAPASNNSQMLEPSGPVREPPAEPERDPEPPTETIDGEEAASEDGAEDATLEAEPEGLLDLSLEDLLDIEITTASGGISESSSITAATVLTITKDDIRHNGWRSMKEILSNVPGIYVVDDLVTPSLSVRGVHGGLRAGTRIVKIMINGVPVNFRPDLTAFLGPEFLPVEAIEQVEIVKGPLSALYGANAFLATVNVITKKPVEGLHSEIAGRVTWQQSSDKSGLGGSALSSYGSKYVDVMMAVTADKYDRSGLQIEQTFDAQASDPNRFPYFDEASSGDTSRPASVWMKLDGKVPEKAVISAQAGMQRLDTSGEFVLNSVLTHQNRIAIYNYWSDLAYVQQWSPEVSTELSVGASHGEPTSDTRFVLASDEDYYRLPQYRYTALDVAGSIRLDFSWLNAKLGGDFENNWEDVLWYKSVPFGPGTEEDPTDPPEETQYTLRSGGVYAALVGRPLYKVVPDLRLSGNIRVDRLSYGDAELPWEPSWRLAATYNKEDDWAVKIFGGRSYQGPSGVLMFAQPGLHGFGTGNNIIGQMVLVDRGFAEEPLKPQSATSVEGAAGVRLFDMISIEGGVFYQKIDDAIKFVPYANNFLAQNSGSQKYVGTDWTVRGVFFNRLSPSFSVSYLHPLSSDDDTIQLYPKLQVLGNVGLAIPEAFLHLSVLGRYVSARGATDGNIVDNITRYYSLPAYGDMDVTLSTAQLYLLGDTQETIITVSGRNLVGKTYFEPGYGGFDYPSTGRTFYFELRQLF